MHRQLSFRESEEGVSPIIGTVLILGIMVTITGTMLAWGIPQIQESEAYAIYTSSQNNLLNFDADLDHVLLQGEGSSRTSTVSLSAGTLALREDWTKLDEIRYYYTTVSWFDPEIVGVKTGSESFAMKDNNEVVSEYRVTLTYPDNDGDGVPDEPSWTGTSDLLVSGFPPLVHGTKATFTSTENSTVIGGFLIYGVDSLSYSYSSVSGVYKMRMFNGAMVSKEPGSKEFFTTSNPLIRHTGSSSSYGSLTVYQTNYTAPSGSKAVQAGNYNFQARNQGGTDNSFSVYSLRMAFAGDGVSALRVYYLNYWDFSARQFDFNQNDSTTAANMGFEEDIIYSQDTAFDFRVLERTINVEFGLR